MDRQLQVPVRVIQRVVQWLVQRVLVQRVLQEVTGEPTRKSQCCHPVKERSLREAERAFGAVEELPRVPDGRRS